MFNIVSLFLWTIIVTKKVAKNIKSKKLEEPSSNPWPMNDFVKFVLANVEITIETIMAKAQ